jgi:hypothetical protein
MSSPGLALFENPIHNWQKISSLGYQVSINKTNDLYIPHLLIVLLHSFYLPYRLTYRYELKEINRIFILGKLLPAPIYRQRQSKVRLFYAVGRLFLA